MFKKIFQMNKIKIIIQKSDFDIYIWHWWNSKENEIHIYNVESCSNNISAMFGAPVSEREKCKCEKLMYADIWCKEMTIEHTALVGKLS